MTPQQKAFSFYDGSGYAQPKKEPTAAQLLEFTIRRGFEPEDAHGDVLQKLEDLAALVLCTFTGSDTFNRDAVKDLVSKMVLEDTSK